MSFFDKVKGALFEEVTDMETSEKKVVSNVNIQNVTTLQENKTFTTVVNSTVNNLVQPVSTGKIKQALSSELVKTLAGSPYLQFQKINSGMKTRVADASTRCVAAGAALDAQGITKVKILDGARDALTFLNGEALSFQNDITSSITGLDHQLKNKTETILASIDEKQQKIKILSEEIANLQKDKSNFEIKVGQDKSQLEVSKIEFNASVNELLQEINADINDITLYLGAS